MEAAARLSEGDVTRGTQGAQTAHPYSKLMSHLDLGEFGSTRQWKREKRSRRHFQVSQCICTWLQTASNDRKQSNGVNLHRIPLLNINMSSGQTVHAQRAHSCIPALYQNTRPFSVNPVTWLLLLHHHLHLIWLITVQSTFSSSHLRYDLTGAAGELWFTPSAVKKMNVVARLNFNQPLWPHCCWSSTGFL